jgi:hypothetical protein
VPDVTIIPGISTEVVCGPDSTVLSPPELDTLTKGNIYDDVLTITEKFSTSNSLCPVIEYSLVSGMD